MIAKVRLISNDLPSEEYNLLTVVASAGARIAICERLHDGAGMEKYHYEDMNAKQRSKAQFKGKLIEVYLEDLTVIQNQKD